MRNPDERFVFRLAIDEGVWYPLHKEDMPSDLDEAVRAAQPYLQQMAQEVNPSGILNEFAPPDCFVGMAHYRLRELPRDRKSRFFPTTKRVSPRFFRVDVARTREEYDFDLSPFEFPGIDLPGYEITLHQVRGTFPREKGFSLSSPGKLVSPSLPEIVSPLYVGLVPDWNILVWYLDEERVMPPKNNARSTRFRSSKR